VLAEVGDPKLTVKVQRLLEDESPMVQERAIEFVCANGADEHIESMRDFLDSDNYNLRVAAVCCAVSHHPDGDFPARANAVLEEMLQSGDATARREAARALGQFPCPQALTGNVERLLADTDPEVVRQAAQTAGKLRRPELLPRLLEKVGDRRVGPAARQAVAAYGPAILPMLRDKLVTPNGNQVSRRAIPQVISLIGTQDAVDMLTNALPQPDLKLRLAVIKGLNKLRSRDPRLVFDAELIRRQLYDELKDLYRLVLLYHGYSGLDWRPHQEPPTNGDLLKSALAERAASVLERISRLLGLIYEPDDLYRAYYGLTNRNHSVRSNALELLDNLLEPADKRALFPIIDDEAAYEYRLHRAEEVGLRGFTRAEALAEVLRGDDPLLVLCAMDAVQTQQLSTLDHEIARATRHIDPMVREAAEKVYAALRS
jgi:HEAT repeat protein